MHSKVFLTNPVDLDLNPAKQYGSIRTINRSYVFSDDLWPTDMIPGAIRWNIQAAARDFNPTLDYLLLAGDHLQVADMVAFIQHYHGIFRVLRWDRVAKGYVVCWIGQKLTP